VVTVLAAGVVGLVLWLLRDSPPVDPAASSAAKVSSRPISPSGPEVSFEASPTEPIPSVQKAAGNPRVAQGFPEQLASALALPEGPAKKLRLDQIFAQWALQDSQAALAAAAAEYETSGNLSMVRSALQGMAEGNPGGALDALKALNLSDRIKIDMGSQLLGQWAGKDAAGASRWAMGNRHEKWWGGPVALVAEVWARSDPQSAIQWSSQLSPGLDQMSAVVAATSRWSKTDLPAVADYVTRQSPGLARDIMAGTLAREFGQEDPSAGLKWAVTVQDPTGRQRAAAGAVADVYGKDPAQAAAILKSSSLSGTEQAAVLARLQSGPWWR
jgi:hypothetical protein